MGSLLGEDRKKAIDSRLRASIPVDPFSKSLESMNAGSGTDCSASPYLTVAEAAAYLRLKPRTLDNIRCNGIGPIYSKHGGRICCSFVDVVAWSRARRRRSTAEKAT
jgi:hypothetical protein